MNNNNIENLINDMRDLQGAKVNIFGQAITLKDSNDNIFNPSVVDLLEDLRGYESDLIGYEYDEEFEDYEEKQFDTIEEYLDYLESGGDIRELKSDNSYNWSSNIDHDIYFTIYKNINEGGFLVELSIHRYGDVRSNYTDAVLLAFDNEYSFLEILQDSTTVVNNITIDDKEYCISIDVFDEGYTVYDRENDNEFMICDYLETEDDFVEAIKEHIQEN